MVSAAPAVQVSSPAEAFAAICLAAVACDGELATLEVRGLRQQLEYRQPYCRFSDAAMERLLDGLLQILRLDGCDALVCQAVPLLDARQRETALAVAADLTRADHVESTAEQHFLARLAQQLEISHERSATILEVIALLNNDSLAG
jgi:uncharacterized tellurite resistance protein B-like protein